MDLEDVFSRRGYYRIGCGFHPGLAFFGLPFHVHLSPAVKPAIKHRPDPESSPSPLSSSSTQSSLPSDRSRIRRTSSFLLAYTLSLLCTREALIQHKARVLPAFAHTSAGPSFQHHFLHCSRTITSLPSHFKHQHFPLQSIASTSKFYCELLVYIVDPNKADKKKRTKKEEKKRTNLFI